MPKIRIKPLLFIGLIVLIFLFVSGTLSPIDLFNWILLRPMINFLMLISSIIPYSIGNFGFGIIILTVLIMILMEPLYRKQLQSMKAMRELQPKLKELQKKYANNQQGLAQAQWQLYKEHGVGLLGCSPAMIIQLPIWIAVYRSVVECLAYTPEDMFGLSKQLYSWSVFNNTIPLNDELLWVLDLSKGSWVLGVLVGITMFVQQKMMSTNTVAIDDQQQTMQNMMLWMMPLLMGFLTVTMPSGLGLYWFLANALRIIVQYRQSGWGGLSGFSFREAVNGLIPGRGGTKTSTVIIPENKGKDKKSGQKSSEVIKQEMTKEVSVEKDPADTSGGGITPKRRKVSNGRNRDKRKVRRRGRRSRSS